MGVWRKALGHPGNSEGRKAAVVIHKIIIYLTADLCRSMDMEALNALIKKVLVLRTKGSSHGTGKLLDSRINPQGLHITTLYARNERGPHTVGPT